MIDSELHLNNRTVQDILTEELGIQKISAKLVLKNPTKEQRENRRNVCLELLKRIENDENFFSNMS